jgi:hypothetical protein
MASVVAARTKSGRTSHFSKLLALVFNEVRPHQGRWCFGKTPDAAFLDALPMTKEKMIET